MTSKNIEFDHVPCTGNFLIRARDCDVVGVLLDGRECLVIVGIVTVTLALWPLIWAASMRWSG